MIGKGARLPEVVEAMKKYDGVYFGAIGGAGALLAKCIKKAELIAYEDLGAEALLQALCRGHASCSHHRQRRQQPLRRRTQGISGRAQSRLIGYFVLIYKIDILHISN